MSIRHHLDEATLVSYSAGAMSQSMALVVACHIAECAECRARLQVTDSIGGLLMDELDSAPIAQGALEAVLACLDDEPVQVKTRKNETAVKRSEVPAPLAQYIGNDLDVLEWKRIVPGVFSFDLPLKGERGGVSRLLRIAPGKAMLPHSHDGNELTLILRGSYCDEMGRFTVGDVADLDSDIDHQPLVDSDQDCICLVATDAPLKFNTLLGKIVQPITGF
ncbi:ChrR family anti-sigma-E factor [Agaribacterium sp. ZY112]|uniref:ChrR family anti-sigma-E factor n=1 Tax=Agaribacterium sp. ZY112 TaxID=3233574 RepID=UPI003525986E